MPACFADTSILVYAFDAAEPEKRQRAISVVEALTRSGAGVLSVQVLNEFARTALRRQFFTAEQTADVVQRFALTWQVLEVSVPEVIEALRGVQERSLSYYDALIWATARLNSIPVILSGDGQDGQYLEGVRVLNPLNEGFDLSSLV